MGMPAADSATAGTEAPGPAASVVVRYWASARAHAGVDSERVPVSGPTSLTDLVTRVVARHPDPRLGPILAGCAVLLGDRPVGRADRGTVVVPPGSTVEFLPPFAGG